jgi:hypothetical protein
VVTPPNPKVSHSQKSGRHVGIYKRRVPIEPLE